MKYLILIILLLCCVFIKAQPISEIKKEDRIIIIRAFDNEADELTEDELKDAYSVKADTTHYYVVFESYFRDNNVRVYGNDSLIFKDRITSNESVELAKTVRVGSVKSIKKISIGIEEDPLIIVHPIKGKYYIYISDWPSRSEIPPYLSVSFSKFPQIRF